MGWVILSVLLLLSGCTGAQDAVADTGSKAQVNAHQENAPSSAPGKEQAMKLTIDNTVVPVTWEHNSSTAALHKLLPLTIKLSPYGGFEQVGSIGQSIPRNDTQTAAKAGDIVLYSGNQIVVFYGSNSWAYTRLGRITDKTEQELTEMLGNRNVVLRFETGLNR